jgi:hypothetical protein
MFERIIEFSTHEDYYSSLQEEEFPTPIKLNIPEWYKKLDHKQGGMTVKGCMPFLDTLTTGYLLKVPQDIFIDHNVLNQKQEPDSFSSFALKGFEYQFKAKGINLNTGGELHTQKQIEGSPFLEKNKNFPIYKIMNPWVIKTPKGYSCLFLPPLNNNDDRFSIIPGIVDTDTYNLEINFPFVINGDKYPQLNTVIKTGTPYVQIIPFKRESWKMITKKITQKKILNDKLFFFKSLLHNYKNKCWNKKIWK